MPPPEPVDLERDPSAEARPDPDQTVEPDLAARVVQAESDAMPEDERVAALLAHSIDVPVLAAAVEQQQAADAADVLEELVDAEAGDVLVAMDDRKASEALAEMQGPLAAGILEDLLAEGQIEYAATLVDLMPPDDAVDVLQQLNDDADRETVLGRVPPATASGLRRLLGYDEETAAGLMTTTFIALREGMTVADAIDLIRDRGLSEDVNHLAVVDPTNRLVGIIGLHALLTNRADRVVAALMDRSPRAIRADLDREDVAREFERYNFHMMPVLDEQDRVMGIVTVDDVIDIIRAEQTEDVHRTVGAGKQEAVYSGVMEKFRGRFPWLLTSFVLMIPSLLVIHRFEGMIEQFAILAVLMPLIAAVAGNAGHQALAVTLRGIVLDEVRPGRVLRLLRRESIAAGLTGSVLGMLVIVVLTALGTVDESASVRLGLVAGGALAASVIAGACAGTCIPLAMRRLGFDPAQSAAIFLIMITDAVAFATILGLAWLVSDWLLGGPGAAGVGVGVAAGGDVVAWATGGLDSGGGREWALAMGAPGGIFEGRAA